MSLNKLNTLHLELSRCHILPKVMHVACCPYSDPRRDCFDCSPIWRFTVLTVSPIGRPQTFVSSLLMTMLSLVIENIILQLPVTNRAVLFMSLSGRNRDWNFSFR